MVKRSGATCRRNRKQRGGNGFGYSFGNQIPGTLSSSEVIRTPSCGQVNRPMPLSSAHGLPGMYGGATTLYTPIHEVYGPNAITNQLRIPCENAFKSTGSTCVGGKRRFSKKTKKMRGGVGGVGSEFYIAPRAGYSHLPSDMAGGDSGNLSDGKTPFLLNVPYASANVPNPACTKTGGRRGKKSTSKKLKKRKSKKSKRSKKY